MEYSSENPTDMSLERLIQELEDTKEQLRKQKTLKEMYINRGKETSRELEVSSIKLTSRRRRTRIIFFRKDWIRSLSPAMRSDSGMRLMSLKSDSRLRLSNMSFRRKPCKESSFNQQHRELEMAQTSSQDKFTAELQVEQQKNNLLQDKLDRISQGYESEVITVRQQAESLQRELEKEVKANADTVSKGLQVITNLKAEQDDLRHRMTKEINNLQQNTLEKEERY
ncbi:uncharacterized protein LOC115567570 isoform X1 [Sparus aurata]|uniref:uncharacterized protein LOC115567570 isoform X1 n=1 Tax=Sparus aurata TaxID=8175 RepID=UPI0011C18453|nr:uncharacterized protein LOC115567570 isoform X1 [Sparus aurata]